MKDHSSLQKYICKTVFYICKIFNKNIQMVISTILIVLVSIPEFCQYGQIFHGNSIAQIYYIVLNFHYGQKLHFFDNFVVSGIFDGNCRDL